MPYPEMMVAPMRDDLVRIGFKELRTPGDVDAMIENTSGTVLLAVNSICGCAAGSFRPGIAMALDTDAKPDTLSTVFAGQDMEATERAREHITGYPPSSPSVALFKDGELVFMLQRHQIEGRSPFDVADELRAAFQKHCG